MAKLIETLQKNLTFVLISLAMMVVVYLIAFGFERLIEKRTGVRFSSEKTKINKMVIMAMFSAVAVVLMYFEFPLTFIAPSFYEMDFSEVPVMMGSFMLGPCAGVIIEAVKIILKICIKGTTTAFVGDFANFILGCVFVIPASVIYHFHKTKKNAVLGLAAGSIMLIVSGTFFNAYYLLPKYSELYGMPIQAFIAAGQEINGSIHDVLTFAALAVAPFNLVKSAVVSVITMLLYKYLSRLLKVHS